MTLIRLLIFQSSGNLSFCKVWSFCDTRSTYKNRIILLILETGRVPLYLFFFFFLVYGSIFKQTYKAQKTGRNPKLQNFFLEAWMPFRLLSNHKNSALGDLKCWVSDLMHLTFSQKFSWFTKHIMHFFLSHSFAIFVIFTSLLHGRYFHTLRLHVCWCG